MTALALFDLSEPETPSIALADVAMPEHARAALRSATIKQRPGERLSITLPQLAPKVYEAVKAIFAAYDITWHRHEHVHIATRADWDLLEEGIASGSFPDTTKALEFFPTSEHGCATLIRILKDMVSEPYDRQTRLLEPEAGDGSLVAVMREAFPMAHITAIELDPLRARRLQRRFSHDPGITIVQADTLTYTRDDAALYDGIAMNPPFGFALEHIKHVTTLVRDGAAIVGFASTERKRDLALAKYLHDIDGDLEEAEPGSFATTTFPAQLFTFRAGPSMFDDLRSALGAEHPSLHAGVIDQLRDMSLQLLSDNTLHCNGDLSSEVFDTRRPELIARARRLVEHEGISLHIPGDPRAGYGLGLVLPSGKSNDFCHEHMIVPRAFTADRRLLGW